MGLYIQQLRNLIESIGKFVSNQKRFPLEKNSYEIEWLFVIAFNSNAAPLKVKNEAHEKRNMHERKLHW